MHRVEDLGSVGVVSVSAADGDRRVVRERRQEVGQSVFAVLQNEDHLQRCSINWCDTPNSVF